MDYEKAYKNALNRAKEYHFDGAKQCITDTLEYIFPELKESEDELTWLTKFIEEETRSLSMDIRDNEDSIKLKNLKKSLVWLEKQGHQEEPQVYETENGEVITYSETDGYKVVEQNPTDKIESKFKVGDILKHNNSNAIVEVLTVNVGFYCLRNILGGDAMELSNVEKNFHLWTIADAKDGDVLYSLDSNKPFIYRYRTPSGQAAAYCGLNIYGNFFVWGTQDCIIILNNYVPATKEQRNTLFIKMKEAGYEWNAEKKELKKIEETINGEDYGIDGLWHAQRILEKTLGNVDGYQSDDGILEHKAAITAVKKLYEQKPIEWSGEDEEMLENVISSINHDSIIEGLKSRGISYSIDSYKRLMKNLIDWLKSIKDRLSKVKNC